MGRVVVQKQKLHPYASVLGGAKGDSNYMRLEHFYGRMFLLNKYSPSKRAKQKGEFMKTCILRQNSQYQLDHRKNYKTTWRPTDHSEQPWHLCNLLLALYDQSKDAVLFHVHTKGLSDYAAVQADFKYLLGAPVILQLLPSLSQWNR